MIIERMQTIFRDLFEDEHLLLTPEMTSADIEDWDSLMHIQLLGLIQREFSIYFSVTEIINLKTVGDLVALIEQKR